MAAELQRLADNAEEHSCAFRYTFDTGCTTVMGYRSDIRAIDPTSSQPVAGNSSVTTAKGIVNIPYYRIHSSLEDAAGCPMTAWNSVRYFSAADAPPLNGPAIRLLGLVALGWVYGGFGPHATGMILANIVSGISIFSPLLLLVYP